MSVPLPLHGHEAAALAVVYVSSALGAADIASRLSAASRTIQASIGS